MLYYILVLFCVCQVRMAFPREERGIKEFDDKEFLTRKTGKENKELTSIKIKFFFVFLGRKLGTI